MLTLDQVQQFESAGYLRCGQLLDQHQIEFLRGEYDREIERAQRDGYVTDLASVDRDLSGAAPQMLQVYGVSMLNIWFRRLAHFDPLVDIVQSLIGPDIQLLHVHLLYKPARHGSVVHWHHDNMFHQCSPPRMLTAWLPLDDVDDSNGAMRFLPGSHRCFTAPDLDGDLEESQLDTTRAELVALRAGEVNVHHCRAVHASGPNASARPRRAVILRYLPIGTASPRLDAETMRLFAHPIVRMAAS